MGEVEDTEAEDNKSKMKMLTQLMSVKVKKKCVDVTGATNA